LYQPDLSNVIVPVATTAAANQGYNLQTLASIGAAMSSETESIQQPANGVTREIATPFYFDTVAAITQMHQRLQDFENRLKKIESMIALTRYYPTSLSPDSTTPTTATATLISPQGIAVKAEQLIPPQGITIKAEQLVSPQAPPVKKVQEKAKPKSNQP